MAIPVEITFLGMDTSEALEATIQAAATRLEHVHDHITRCEVVVAVPHQHKRHGRHVRVAVRLAVPGGDIVVSRVWNKHDIGEDAHAAAREAFDTARRLLLERAARARAHADTHPLRPVPRTIARAP